MLIGNDTRFEIVLLLTCNKIANLRSQHYKAYFVSFNGNITRSAGWLVCQYAEMSGCPLEKALNSFGTEKGGISRRKRHTATHERTNVMLQSQRQLPLAAKSKIAHAEVCAVSFESDLFHFSTVTLVCECSRNLSSKLADQSQKMRTMTLLVADRAELPLHMQFVIQVAI